MTSSIGIVGSRGFIGSYLLRRLVVGKRGPLRALVRTPSLSEYARNIDVVCGDLRSPADCLRFADGLKVIYYLAHTNSPVNSDQNLANDTLYNLVPLLQLIQAVQSLGTKAHIVYFGSGGAVYAPKDDRLPYVETDHCAPLSSYGIQKVVAEQYLRLAAHKGHLTSTVLRVGNAYGEPLPQHRMQGLIGIAISCILQSRPVRIFGDLTNVRDYIHLEDICSLADRASTPRQPFSIVNVGSGVGHSVSDVLRIIEECHGAPIVVQCEQTLGHWLPQWVVLNVLKANREFGWSPAISLRSGINEMLLAEREERGVGEAIG